MNITKITLLCFLLAFVQQANALNIPEKYQSPQKIENKTSFIKGFFSYNNLRYDFVQDDDPKLWRQIETCETKYDGGSLILEQYMYNNRPDTKVGGGLIGLLFYQQNGEITFIRAEHMLTNYRQKCFIDVASGTSNDYLYFDGNIEEDHEVYSYVFLKKTKKLYLYINQARNLATAGIPTKEVDVFTVDQALYIAGNSLCSVPDFEERSNVVNGKLLTPYCQDSLIKINGKNKYIAPYIAYDVVTGEVSFDHIKSELMNDCGRSIYPKPMSLSANLLRTVQYLKKSQQFDHTLKQYLTAECGLTIQ